MDYKNLPQHYLKSDEVKGAVRTRIYQFTAVHQAFADKLNVVILCKYDEKKKKSGHIILFCTEGTLGWEALVDYYCLRFRIEFNFRDAKQHWGLEDFMVTQKRGLLNAAHLSLFMVNLSHTMMAASGESSILDLKARYHGLRYVQEIFKILPKQTDVINIDDWISRVPVLGRIHKVKNAA